MRAMSILDHVGLSVSDFARSKAFYEKAFAPLSVTLVREYPDVAGFGRGGKPEFWIALGKGGAITPIHIAILATSRAEVDAFHVAALAAGAKDNGAPGLREMYHPNYYGAFVLDPDGHNVEAVIHRA